MSAIDDKFQQLKKDGLDLGKPKGAEAICADNLGRFREYEGGWILWHPQHGAHEIHGAIEDRYSEMGREQSWLGYPIADEQIFGKGRRSLFEHGSIRWSSATGAVDGVDAEWVMFYEQNQARFDTERDARKASGFVLESVAVSGTRLAPVYATVYAKRKADWSARGGMNEAGLLEWLEQEAEHGRHLRLVSASSSGSAQVFAASTEALAPVAAFALRYADSGSESLRRHSGAAHAAGNIPTSISLYERGTAEWAAAVFRPNAEQVPWSSVIESMSPAVDNAAAAIHAANGAWPVITAISPSGRRATLYTEDSYGKTLRSGSVTVAQARASTDERGAQGFVPRHVDAAGEGSARRLSIVFAKRWTPVPRRLAVTGRAVAELKTIDDAFGAYLRRGGIRTATVAVAKDHRLIYARTFTWAPPGFPVAQVDNTIRIGSISKTLTAIVACKLVERGVLDLRTPVHEILSCACRPEYKGITLGDTLVHYTAMAGIRQPDGKFRGYGYLPRDVLAARGLTRTTVGKRDTAEAWMLAAEPGSWDKAEFRYGNHNFLMAGAAIEHATGKRYVSVLKDLVLKPLGIVGPEASGSTLARRKPLEVHQHDRWLCIGDDNVSDQGGHRVRCDYGVNNHENIGDSIGGMTFAAADYVRILASLASTARTRIYETAAAEQSLLGAFGDPPAASERAAGVWPGRSKGFLHRMYPGGWSHWHNGGLGNTHSETRLRDDGVAWMWACGGGSLAGLNAPDMDALINKVGGTKLPKHDIFADVGREPLG